MARHSDRGSQYTSDDSQQRLANHSIKASMSGTEHCYDNAAMESFFATLKTQCIYHQQYKTRQEAEWSIFDYTEIFYNNQRQPFYLGYLSPKVYEEQYYQSNKNLHYTGSVSNLLICFASNVTMIPCFFHTRYKSLSPAKFSLELEAFAAFSRHALVVSW